MSCTIPECYTWDTNVVIKSCENSNFVSLLKTILPLPYSRIYVTSQSILELSNLGFNSESLIKQIKEKFGIKVIISWINDYVQSVSNFMLDDCKQSNGLNLLHEGDSQILAFTKCSNTKLVSCDKNLIKAAYKQDVYAINPYFPLNETTKTSINLKPNRLEKLTSKILSFENKYFTNDFQTRCKHLKVINSQ